MKRLITLIVLLTYFASFTHELKAQIVEAEHLAPQISSGIGCSNLQIDVPQAGAFYSVVVYTDYGVYSRNILL